MTPDILSSLLWRVRSSIRIRNLNFFAGHGVADPVYRPPRLPYAAVIGPLNLEVESERDLPRSLFLWVRGPGVLLGEERLDEHLVPDPGSLHVRMDGYATAHLDLDFEDLAGEQLNEEANAQSVAGQIQDAIMVAVEADEIEFDEDELADELRAELLRTTCRWDRTRNRLVISSGRRGVLGSLDIPAGEVSRIEILDGADNVADTLGFGAGAQTLDGRIFRHRIPSPMAVAVDVRLDLWAGSQRELAAILDRWSYATPTRGQLLVGPGLLSADVSHGDEVLRIQNIGEPPTPWTLTQLEPELEFADRLTGRTPTQTGGVAFESDHMRFPAAASATLSFHQPPAIPQPWRDEHPAPDGFAATFGFEIEGGAPDQQARIFQLTHGDLEALRVNVVIVSENGDNFGEISAAGQHVGGSQFGEIRGRVPIETLQNGVDLHVLVSSSAGMVSLFVDGVPLPPEDGAPDPSPGTVAGGDDMDLVMGGPADADLVFRITHLQLHGRPFGPPDPLFRQSLSRASQWKVGDPISIAPTVTGYSAAGDPFNAVVIAVEGDTVRLDRPVQRNWRRSETLVYWRNLFFSQKQLRRRDDFMNKLYRITAEYRVSAFLEERLPTTTAPLAEESNVELRVLSYRTAEVESSNSTDAPDYPSRPAPGRPGVFSTIRHK